MLKEEFESLCQSFRRDIVGITSSLYLEPSEINALYDNYNSFVIRESPNNEMPMDMSEAIKITNNYVFYRGIDPYFGSKDMERRGLLYKFASQIDEIMKFEDGETYTEPEHNITLIGQVKEIQNEYDERKNGNLRYPHIKLYVCPFNIFNFAPGIRLYQEITREDGCLILEGHPALGRVKYNDFIGDLPNDTKVGDFILVNIFINFRRCLDGKLRYYAYLNPFSTIKCKSTKNILTKTNDFRLNFTQNIYVRGGLQNNKDTDVIND